MIINAKLNDMISSIKGIVGSSVVTQIDCRLIILTKYYYHTLYYIILY